MEQFDIVVAGAGPAGVVMAVHLAQAGVRVLLLEAAPAPAQDLRLHVPPAHARIPGIPRLEPSAARGRVAGVARQYRRGRVILVGDAAHLNNPLGGFGMNAALHDVRNLCGKLVPIVLDGAEAEPLLAAYERQRRTVMHEFIQAQSMQNKRLIEMSGGDRQAAQEAELSATAADPVRRRAYLLRQSMLSAVAREREIA